VAERAAWAGTLVDNANDAYHAGNLDKAFMIYLLAAEQGFEIAQTNVAFMIEQGWFVQF